MSSAGAGLRIGVVGATDRSAGDAGGLAERDFPVAQIRFFASARSAGSTLPWNGEDIVVETLRMASVEGLDIALFSAGATTSRAQAPRFAAAGVTVVDNSSAWRMDPAVPLVVSEVNPQDALDGHRRTRPGRHHREPELHHHGGDAGAQAATRRRRVGPAVVTTFQAVSGSGLDGVAELDGQIRAVFDGRRAHP